MSIADLIQWARTGGKSGNLTLRDGGGEEMLVVFVDGRIVCCANRSPRATYGRYLVQLGICTEADVAWGLRREQQAGIMLGAALVGGGRLDERLAVATLTDKAWEDICDAFLWREGTFEFFPSAFQPQQYLPINLDPLGIVVQGIGRRESWTRLTARIPGYTVFERRLGAALPTGLLDPVVAHHVGDKLDGRRTVDEVMASLPFGRYKVLLSLEQLMEAGCLTVGDATEVGHRRVRRDQLLNQAREAERAGQWGEAIQILEGLIARYPNDDEVVPALVAALDGFERYVHGHNFGLEDVPVVAIGEAAGRLSLDPAAGFLLSRIDGTLTVRQILKISPVPGVEALRVLKRLYDARVIDFPHRR